MLPTKDVELSWSNDKIQSRIKRQKEMICKLEGKSENELFCSLESFESKDAQDTGNWIVLLNVSNDTGVNGAMITTLLEPFKYTRIEMYDGMKSYSYCQLESKSEAIRAFNELHLSIHPGSPKLILVSLAGPKLPSFPLRPFRLGEEVASHIPGLNYLPQFLSQQEQQDLISTIITENNVWQSLKQRHIMHFGYIFDYNTREADLVDLPLPFPSWTKGLLKKMESMYPPGMVPDQLTINHYDVGGGIAYHTDTHSSFLSPLMVISLGGSVTMQLKSIVNGDEFGVYLEGGSLLVMDGDSRYAFEHCIRPRRSDLVDGVVTKRQEGRYSLTFRNIRPPGNPCVCGLGRYCI